MLCRACLVCGPKLLLHDVTHTFLSLSVHVRSRVAPEHSEHTVGLQLVRKVGMYVVLQATFQQRNLPGNMARCDKSMASKWVDVGHGVVRERAHWLPLHPSHRPSSSGPGTASKS